MPFAPSTTGAIFPVANRHAVLLILQRRTPYIPQILMQVVFTGLTKTSYFLFVFFDFNINFFFFFFFLPFTPSTTGTAKVLVAIFPVAHRHAVLLSFQRWTPFVLPQTLFSIIYTCLTCSFF